MSKWFHQLRESRINNNLIIVFSLLQIRNGKILKYILCLPLFAFAWAYTQTPSNLEVNNDLRILAIGVDEFLDFSITHLDFAAKDAQDFANVFRTQENNLYDSLDIKTLTNQETNLAIIKSELNRLSFNSKLTDTTILFIAGHGINNHTQDYFIPLHDSNTKNLVDTALSQHDLLEFLQNTQGKVLIFLDTCHSGAVVGSDDPAVSTTDFLIEDLHQVVKRSNNKAIITATTGNQFAKESAMWNNGAFTKAIIEALTLGKVGNLEGQISILELASWITKRVVALTIGQQTPAVQFTGVDFTIFQHNPYQSIDYEVVEVFDFINNDNNSFDTTMFGEQAPEASDFLKNCIESNNESVNSGYATMDNESVIRGYGFDFISSELFRLRGYSLLETAIIKARLKSQAEIAEAIEIKIVVDRVYDEEILTDYLSNGLNIEVLTNTKLVESIKATTQALLKNITVFQPSIVVIPEESILGGGMCVSVMSQLPFSNF